MAKLLALMNIRNVNFDGRNTHGGNRIAHRQARVGVGRRIDHDGGKLAGRLLNPVTNSPSWLDWRKSISTANSLAKARTCLFDLRERQLAIYLRLTSCPKDLDWVR